MNTLDVLVNGRKQIATGWVQGHYEMPDDDGNPQFCSLGSINRILAGSARSSHGASSLRKKVIRYLSAAAVQEGLAKIAYVSIPFAQSLIIRINDANGRTKSEVLSWFDRAIRNARRRHING